jgi:hypothetical protein
VDLEVASPDTAGTAPVAAADPPQVLVYVDNPLAEPYRTGSYLIYDFKATDQNHFRNEFKRPPDDHPYRASGSRQLDLNAFLSILRSIDPPSQPSTLYLVDLREETHGFLFDEKQGPKGDYRAVSWYADNDFSNAGEPWDWIKAEEENRFAFLREWLSGKPDRKARIFDIVPDTSDNRCQQRMKPTGYRDIRPIKPPLTEKQLFDNGTGKIGTFTVQYVRIPVTDHCAPSDTALTALRALAAKVKSTDWVHFHCHGGDGRTTTFLALYDMWRWKTDKHPNYPPLDKFAERQYNLVPYYCLNPSGCGSPPPPPAASASDRCQPWKFPLAKKRWEALCKFHANPLGP